MKQKSDIGLIGLAVMGENLVLNMASKGFTVSVFNRSTDKVNAFIHGRAKGKTIRGCHNLQELTDSLEKPRKIMLMVKAGKPVDDTIEQLLPLLEPGDIIIDGGNSHFPDSDRRTQYLKEKGILYIGSGVSGGEEGALLGPSIMPGGNEEAWPAVKPIFQTIAAQAPDGSPCCDWVGNNGAGHFVKMVHNGIEYGDMQLITEAYHLLKSVGGLNNQELHQVFRKWNEGDLDSYLIEITSQIFDYKDTDGQPLVNKILDTAGQKGTGKWTSINALDLGIPLTLITEAVFARYLSAQKDERVAASHLINEPEVKLTSDKMAFINDVEDALFAAKIVSYAQGFALIRMATKEFGYNINLGNVALLWRAGCIIRSAFLDNIKQAFEKNPELDNLLIDGYFLEKMNRAQAGWRRAIAAGVVNGIPMPAMSSALSYFDGYRSRQLPANLLQAMRDYFGAHTYERTDQPRGEFFHTNWTGRGGSTASTTYNA
ncbi:MAG: decarboxylating NADP(+)-dependent phosphogluconate dehydrogenase [Breznakibacter sp.]